MQELFEGPPPPAVDESLRTDYRMGAISQFVNTFKSHIGLEFDILVSSSAAYHSSLLDPAASGKPVELPRAESGRTSPIFGSVRIAFSRELPREADG